jgi:hypothetical protein
MVAQLLVNTNEILPNATVPNSEFGPARFGQLNMALLTFQEHSKLLQALSWWLKHTHADADAAAFRGPGSRWSSRFEQQLVALLIGTRFGFSARNHHAARCTPCLAPSRGPQRPADAMQNARRPRWPESQLLPDAPRRQTCRCPNCVSQPRCCVIQILQRRCQEQDDGIVDRHATCSLA